MGSFKYIHNNEKIMLKDKKRKRELLLEMQNTPMIVRIDRPTKLARAKLLGYKAKQGYIVLRVRVSKGGFRRPRPVHARRPSKTGLYFNLAISKQKMAEQRAFRYYRNMEVVGSYLLVGNGKYNWFEIIMRDASTYSR